MPPPGGFRHHLLAQMPRRALCIARVAGSVSGCRAGVHSYRFQSMNKRYRSAVAQGLSLATVVAFAFRWSVHCGLLRIAPTMHDLQTDNCRKISPEQACIRTRRLTNARAKFKLALPCCAGCDPHAEHMLCLAQAAARACPRKHWPLCAIRRSDEACRAQKAVFEGPPRRNPAAFLLCPRKRAREIYLLRGGNAGG